MINKITKLITDKKYRFNVLLRHGFYNKWSDERFLKKIYKIRMGESLNLECPVTFNEKLQWLKLHDRNPLYTKMVGYGILSMILIFLHYQISLS